MALAKPEVKPTSPAAFGNIEIPFQYKVNLEEKSEVSFTIKVFDINNKLLFTNTSYEYEKISNIDYIATTNLGGLPEGYIQGIFYKAALQISYDGEDSPWSNLTIFKYTTHPTINAIEMGRDLKGVIKYSSKDKTETLERVKYKYWLEHLEESVALSEEELIITEEMRDDNHTYSLEFPSLFNYPLFRKKIVEFQGEDEQAWISISIQCSYYTKNGVYNHDSVELLSLRAEQGTNDPKYPIYNFSIQQDSSRITLTPTQYFQGDRIYHIFNGDLLIHNNATASSTIEDIVTDYINTYSAFGTVSYNSGTFYLCFHQFNPLVCDFDSLFLIDGKLNQQLNITLNNSVNSFKYNIPETKTDTIGSQYPIFFRNPNIKYREFPLSGTISYHSLVSFGKDQGIDFSLPEMLHTNLTTDNLYTERIFREKVVEFLTKDRPLLYKSQTEGNIVVKLMNIQFIPNKTLGRMIYDFSCTCYEVQDLQSYIKECWE